MALSFVASSSWVSGTGSVTPTMPTGWAVGDLLVIFLFSKYEDAVLPSSPAGWDDLGVAVNAPRTQANDNGGMRGRAFARIATSGQTAPTFSPSPNNMSAVHMTAYRVDAGKTYEYVAFMGADDTTGTPLLIAANSLMGVFSGDTIHTDLAVNGDVVTFSAQSTLTITGTAIGAASTNVADAAFITGTDARARSVRWPITSGSATSNPQVSTPLSGTTTNAVGVGLILRLREVDPVAHEETITDSVGLSDSRAQQTQTNSEETDDIGLADSHDASLVGGGPGESHSDTVTDALGIDDPGEIFTGGGDADLVGLTDFVVVTKTQSHGDALGLSDSTTAAVTYARTTTDVVGLTDQVSPSGNQAETRTDQLGLADSAVAAAGAQRTFADSAGLTDVTVSSTTKSVSDQLGLADSTAVQTSLFRVRDDALGLADSVFASVEVDALVDGLGVTDDVAAVAFQVAAVTDQAGLSDSVAAAVDLAVQTVDPLGLADSVHLHLSVAVDDALSLTDSAEGETGVRQHTDSLGLTDSVVAEVGEWIGQHTDLYVDEPVQVVVVQPAEQAAAVGSAIQTVVPVGSRQALAIKGIMQVIEVVETVRS